VRRGITVASFAVATVLGAGIGLQGASVSPVAAPTSSVAAPLAAGTITADAIAPEPGITGDDVPDDVTDPDRTGFRDGRGPRGGGRRGDR
jgi:hypothetical protein